MNDSLPHRAEHIGSLLRPQALKDAFRARAAGRLGDDAFRSTQDGAIREAVALQHEAGLRSITDGEFRRAAWSAGFVWALQGLEPAESLFEFRDDAGDVIRWQTCHAVAPIRRTRAITLDEHGFVAALTGHDVKVTMPAPSFLHFFRGRRCVAPGAYTDLARFWDDVVAVYRAEIAELARAGARYLQLDEVPVAMLCDDDVRARVRAAGDDPDELLRAYTGAVNRALADRPRSLTVGMHLCRGNLRGHWMASGGYEAVAERLFNETEVDAFFLEYDSPRAGDFSPLRFVPANKRVVLGLVSSKQPALETLEALRRRIDEATRYLPLERLGISPQCGFASTVGGNPLTIEDERAKLRLVVDVAREVWGTA
jgi:5-methyltetrahydropteroyltriglutamate--homocysteine methyltransferase